MTEPTAVLRERSVSNGEQAPASERRIPSDGFAGRDDEIDLAPYLYRLANDWKLILSASLIAGLVVVVALSALPPVYEATATLLVAPARLNEGEAAGVGPFRVLLQNNTLAQTVTAKFGLDQAPFNLTPLEFLESATEVEDIRGLNILLVKVRLRDDPQRAADVASALAHGVVKLAQQISQQEGSLVGAQLRGQLDLAKERLARSEQALTDSREQAQLEVRQGDVDAVLAERENLALIRTQIADEQARLAQAERDLATHARILEFPRNTGISGALLDLAAGEYSDRNAPAAKDPRRAKESRPEEPEPKPQGTTPASEKKRAAAEDEKIPSRQQLTAERPLPGLDLSSPVLNPVFEALQFQIALSRSRLAGLQSRRAAIEGLSGGLASASKELYTAEMTVKRLETEYDLARRVYEDIAFQYEHAQTLVTRRSAQLQVINEAVRPERPASRGRLRWGAVAVFGGAIMASFWVLGWRGGPSARRT